MMWRWLKMLVLVVALLSQVAMSCQSGEQGGGSATPQTAPPRRGY